MDEKSLTDLRVHEELQLGLKYISQYSILPDSLFCMEPTVSHGWQKPIGSG